MLTTIVLLTVGVLAEPLVQQAKTSEESDIRAVRRYVSNEFVFESDFAREFASQGRISRETTGLGAEIFKHHRLYAFPERPGTPQSFVLVAVDDGGRVSNMSVIDEFNEVLRREKPRIENESQARAVLDAFLWMQHYSNFRSMKWELGLNVVSTVEDIPFASGSVSVDELRTLRERYAIRAPKLERAGRLFRLELYSWQPVGGVLMRHLAILDPAQGISYSADVLGQWLGDYRAGH